MSVDSRSALVADVALSSSVGGVSVRVDVVVDILATGTEIPVGMAVGELGVAIGGRRVRVAVGISAVGISG